MDLRERLRLLKAAGAARAAAAEPAAAQEPADPSPIAAPADRTPAMLGGALDGCIIATELGETFYTETRYPLEYCRGPLPLEHLFQVPGTAWALLGRVPPDLDMRRAVFFDTETTGLAGGTGTHAFLVGLGFFEGYDFVVRQYFLRDYGEEEALLESVAGDLAPFDVLVSFNGKSFDWPLMETRYRMMRRQPPLQGIPHLDLLHPARRLWKERLGQCNLQNLEAQVLNVWRQGDVPGHLIPQLYFDYLRSGNVTPLVDVILHNRYDIVSLVSLAGWMGHITANPLGPTPDGELVCGDDLYALGRLLEDRGCLAEGLTCYQTACERGVTAVSEHRVLQDLSRAYKRAKEHSQALSIWEQMIAGTPGASLFPYVEMAKYHEHVTREYHLASEMAQEALALAERRRSMAGVYGPAALRDVTDLQRRLQRLERKLSRKSQDAV